MSPFNESTRMAAGSIRLSALRLAAGYAFHAKTLERFRLTAEPRIATMGVAVVGNSIQLLFNPDFVLSISLAELGGVLLHEVHHVVLGHLLQDSRDFPDEWALTIAQEVSANEFITEPLPGSPIRLEQFPNLPPMESTDQRYLRLRRETDRASFDPAGGEALSGEGTADAAGALVDDHSVWQSVADDPEHAAAVVRAVIQDAVIEVGVDRVPAELRGLVRHLGVGRNAGHHRELLGGGGRGSLDWVRLLRRFVARHVTRHVDLGFPPRRFPQLVGIVPARRRRPRSHVMVVLDTSASMTTELLELVEGEVRRLAGHHRVTIVECDAEIQRVYPYRRLDSVFGRGGTDLRPALERSFLRKHRPDVVVYCTDGDGPAPGEPPDVPVLWCLTPSGHRPAEWGTSIRMATDVHRSQ